MADTVAITAGAGTSIATQDEGGVHYQEVKLTASGTGTTEALSKAEDAAHSTGHHGIAALAVRRDTAVVGSDTDGDYSTLNVDGSGRLHVNVGTSALPTGAATAAKQPALGTAGSAATDVITVQGIASATPVLTTLSGTNNINNISGTVSLPTGASTAAKQPALGTAGTASSDVITVQGIASMTPVLATLSGTNNIATVTTVTAIGTSVTPGTSAAHLGKAEDAAHTSADTGVMMLAVRQATNADLSAGGTDGDYEPLQVDATGKLWTIVKGLQTPNGDSTLDDTANAVKVLLVDAAGAAISSGTEYTEADVDTSISGVAMMWEDTSDTLRSVSAAKPLPVNIISGAGSGGTAIADDAAFTVGTTNLTPVGGTYRTVRDSVNDNDAGAFAMTATRALYATLETPNGDSMVDDTNDAVKVVNATAANFLANVGGAAAHDAAVSGNPVRLAGRADTALSTITLVADGDTTDLYAGIDGVLITRPHSGLEDIVSGNASNTDGTSTQVIAAGGAGVKQYLTSITLTNTSAGNTFCEIKSGTTTKWTFPVPANGGVTHSWDPPLPPNAANEAWNFDPGAATTTMYCSMVAFKSKV